MRKLNLCVSIFDYNMSKKAPVQEPEAEKAGETQAILGSGRFSFPDGSFYEGEWKEINGIKSRDGMGLFSSGPESYKGSWVNDAMEGDGTYTFASGAVYSGSFAQNKFNGNGKYQYADGAYYMYGL